MQVTKEYLNIFYKSNSSFSVETNPYFLII